MHGMLDSWKFIAVEPAVGLPVFAGLSWWWLGAFLILFALLSFLLLARKRKRPRNKYWNDYFVDPPEYQDPVSAESVKEQHRDLFKHYLGRFLHKKSTAILKVQEEVSSSVKLPDSWEKEQNKNYYLWDDGMIFCGFKLQGTDFRYPDLYGAYLRDMFLRECVFGRMKAPLIFSDAEAYAAVDMSGAFLQNELMRDIVLNRVDWGQVDLSGVYLRSLGLRGINPEEFLEPEEDGLSDFLISGGRSDKV